MDVQLEGKGEVDHSNSITNSANHGKTTIRTNKGKDEVSSTKVSVTNIIIKIIIKINKINRIGTVDKSATACAIVRLGNLPPCKYSSHSCKRRCSPISNSQL